MPERRIGILIVDDEPSVRHSFAQIFTQLNYDARCAADGFSALCELRLGVPDILLTDLNMPGMSGFELLSVVRRRFPGVQVIAMSGAYTGEDVPPGVAADAFHPKGTGIGPLLEIVQTMGRQERKPLLEVRGE